MKTHFVSHTSGLRRSCLLFIIKEALPARDQEVPNLKDYLLGFCFYALAFSYERFPL